MARQTKVILVDDIDGERADETVSFALDGTAYEIDLSEDKARKLRDAFAPFVDRARRVRADRGRGRVIRTRNDEQALRLSRELSADIRRWAREHDYPVSTRGRIAADVVKAYQEVH
ncbi:Lsr2 family protein [Streptosporangiaceae bacterium NEAU-GS5]|nr:Lsr2 family protein [Streptosporangiaceae bacterium NEAU-GS5]